jgi:protein SCO1/2
VNSLTVKIWLSVLLLALAGYAAWSGVKYLDRQRALDNPKSNLNMRPIRHLAEYEFTERDGRNVRFADLEGKVVVLNFFFANCPGTCRLLNDKVASLHKRFGSRGVQFVSVTIDPSADTPDRLKKYAEAFGADEHWWFVTGPLENTQDLGRSLRLAAVGRDTQGNLTHTDEIVVLDRAGTIRGAFDHRDPKKLTAAGDKIEELLEEKTPPPQASPTTSPTVKPTSSPTPTAKPTGSTAATIRGRHARNAAMGVVCEVNNRGTSSGDSTTLLTASPRVVT